MTDATTEVSPIRLVDLFAGCGGLTAGFVSAGSNYRPVRAVELDPQAAATYALNHGEHVYVGDVHEWLSVEGSPDADVVVGGPPCQGFSTLGTKNPNDPRNALWDAYVEAVAMSRPKVFVIENVPRFLTSDQFASLSSETAPGGRLANYELEPMILNAADFGAPQNRRRAIVIGRLSELLPLGEPTPITAGRPKTVKRALRGVSHMLTDCDLPDRSVSVNGGTFRGPFTSKELHLTRRFEARSLERFASIPEGGNRFDIPDRLLSECWRKHERGSTDVMGRLHWNSPSVTIRTEFFKPEKGRYLHPVADRAITPFEACRLQGFPDDYTWAGSKVAISRQIGNAVPIPLGRSIADHLTKALTTADTAGVT